MRVRRRREQPLEVMRCADMNALKAALRKQQERLFHELMDEVYGPVIPSPNELDQLEQDMGVMMERRAPAEDIRIPPQHDV